MSAGEGASHGQFYWAVATKAQTIRLYADVVKIHIDGSVSFERTGGAINMAFANGEWEHFYAASVIDGGAVAVEHWDRRSKVKR